MPYTSDQLRAAYKAAEAAGDTQAHQKLLSAFIEQKVAEQNAAGMNDYDAAEGQPWHENLRAGIGQGMTNVARHAGNLVGLVTAEELAESRRLDQDLLDTGAGNVGSFIGEVTATAPLGFGVGQAARVGGAAGRALASPVGRGIAEGAAQGVLMADPGGRGAGAIIGGALGSVIPGLGSAGRRVAQGVKRTPEAQMLLDRGIDLTPGQMNPTGVMNRMEQAAEGTLGVGDVVQNSRENAMRQFNRSFVEDAVAPGAKLTSHGDFNALVDEAARSFDAAYDVAKGFPVGAKIMPTVGPDIPLSKAFESVVKKPRLGLTQRARDDVGEQLQAELNELIQVGRRSGPGLASDDLLAFRSMIRQAIRDEAGDTAESRARREMFKAAGKKVTEALESQIPEDAAKAIRAADEQYAKFAIVRETAKKAKDRPDGPTPFQVSQAIAQATDSNTYARGGGLGRDLSKAARETFQSNVPRTGLAGVGRLGAAISGAVAAPQVVIPALAGAAGMVGTKTGRRLAAGATKPQRLAQALMEQVERDLSPEARRLLAQYARRGSVTAALMSDR